jgi:hypothetical protein
MGKQAEARERWSERITEQEASGLSIRAYCKERGIGEHSFYVWRQRLRRTEEPVGLALVETKRREPEHERKTFEPSRQIKGRPQPGSPADCRPHTSCG